MATAIVATGGPTNPVGIAVTIAAGVATVLTRFLKIGAGRAEADYLTDPGTGAQWHAGEALRQLIDEQYLPKLYAGEATPGFIQGVIAAIEKIRDDFIEYAKQFARAGPGAIATIRSVTDRLIADRRRELAGLDLPAQEGMANMYRLVFEIQPGIIKTMTETGADEAWFEGMPAALDYAALQGETVLYLNSDDDFWAIVNGDVAPEMFQSSMLAGGGGMLVLAGLAAFFLLRRRKR